jgi:threonine dehydrogenase-like Zn-dependent dehydrogenase
MIMARTIWFERPAGSTSSVAVVREEPLREPGPGEVRVQAICSGVSAGTERLVLRGGVPPEAHAIMALPLMRGSFDLPIAYGYATVGTIDAVGAGVDHGRVGERVFLLHPHQDRLIAPEAELRPLPREPPAPRMVLAPNLETAVNVIWDAEVSLGDRVLVTGLGVVGLLITWLAVRAGASAVTGVDPDRDRRSLATTLGAAVGATAPDPAAIAAADVLIEASGAPSALASLVEHAGPEARIIVASWYGREPTPLPLGGRFHPHRVTIRSSQVAHIDPQRSGRWSHARRFDLVSALLRDSALDRLIAPPVPLSTAPEVYAELAAGARWNPPQRVFDATR